MFGLKKKSKLHRAGLFCLWKKRKNKKTNITKKGQKRAIKKKKKPQKTTKLIDDT